MSLSNSEQETTPSDKPACRSSLPECKKSDNNTTELESEVRFKDGCFRLRNRNIEKLTSDYLYHLNLGSGTHDLVEMFGDVKFVCMGGTAKRMETFANYMLDQLDNYKLPAGESIRDITASSNRYAMYKVGPVLSISHGIGIASLGVLCHEVTKLMYHAKIKDPIFIRIGTSGGIGVEPGTVVISEGAVDEMLNEYYEQPILGKLHRRPAILDQQFAQEIKAVARPEDPYKLIIGKTLATSDFYEGQGRLDGAFCEFTEKDKLEYLTKLHDRGVRNIEMECTFFSAFTHHAGIKTAIVCVTLLNRLMGDQVTTPKNILHQWELRPQEVVGRYIKWYLQHKM